MDSPQAPLIPDERRELELQDDVDDARAYEPVEAAQRSPPQPGLFVLLLTFAAGISGLLFGYDTGVMSATLVSIGTSLSNRELTSMDMSIITSSTSLFALLISPFSSVLADRFGRKSVVLYADVFFVVGAIIQAFSYTVGAMVLGRCVIGAAVGAASFVVPLYLAEVAPAAYRGRLVTTNVLFITMGQVVAYIVGWAFSTFGTRETGWRWMVGLGALPAALQAAILVFMPETPRWLVRAGRSAEARMVLVRVYGGAEAARSSDADATVKGIETEVREERDAQRLRGHELWHTWRELIFESRNRRALSIACLLQGLQQLCGFNSLMYYSATIFTLVGFKSPTLTSMTVAVTNFVFTLAALSLIDRIGRRRILLYSIPFMVAGLVLAAVGFSYITVGPPTGTEGVEAGGAAGSTGAAATILASIMVYVAAYAIGLGNVPWMQSELFPLGVRSLGSGVATATNWGANFVVGLTFLLLMDGLTPPWTFALYAGVCAVGYALIWSIYPEMAGVSLEQNAQES